MADDQVTIVRPSRQEKYRPLVKCAYEDCDRWVWARGYCGSHYHKLKNAGLLQNVRTPKGDLLRKFYANIEVNPETLCWEWTGYLNQGYGNMAVGAESKNIRSSRYAYELFYGPVPEGKLVCHHCDVKKCCNPSHLYAGTFEDNARDCVERKLHSSFSDRIFRTPTKQMAMNIRIIYARGQHSYFDLAEIYGVCIQTIGAIVKGSRHLNMDD